MLYKCIRKPNENCWLFNEYKSECLICDLNYYMSDNNKCLKSELYEVDTKYGLQI